MFPSVRFQVSSKYSCSVLDNVTFHVSSIYGDMVELPKVTFHVSRACASGVFDRVIFQASMMN